MKRLKKLPLLRVQDLEAILLGGMRNEPIYKHMYSGLNGNDIIINGYRLYDNDSGHLTIPAGLPKLRLTFENCEIKSVVADQSFEELKFIGCDMLSLEVDKGEIVQLLIEKNRNEMEQLLIRNSAVLNLEVDATIGLLQYVGDNVRRKCVARINGHVAEMMMLNINNINIQKVTSIGVCQVLNSEYPFQGMSVAIEKLEILNPKSTYLVLSGCFGAIQISGSRGDIELKNLCCLDNCQISEAAHGNGLVTLMNVYIGRTLLLRNMAPDLRIWIGPVDADYIYVNELEVMGSINGLSIRSTNYDALVMINVLRFSELIIAKDRYWDLHAVHLRELQFKEFRNAGNGNINNMIPGSFNPMDLNYEELLGLYLHDVVDELFFRGHCALQELSIEEGLLSIFSSDMGKLNFIDSDFSRFRLFFYSTKLAEIFLAGSRLPKKVIVPANEGVDVSHQERIANTQLKKLHEQHGDIVAANEFFANEMNAYFYSLSWRLDFWEKLPLLLNKVSSNHGQSWIRALISNLIIAVIFFSAFAWSLGFYPADPFGTGNMDRFWLISSYLLDFINPIHRLETFKDLTGSTSFPVGSRYIDGISRIFIAYCGYQLIQAFRKHGRSK